MVNSNLLKGMCCKSYWQSGIKAVLRRHWYPDYHPMSQRNPFKWRHYESEIILLCVRWYLRYALSYRDLEEMMEELNLTVDHTTIYRWVQRYAPELVEGLGKGDIRGQGRFVESLF